MTVREWVLANYKSSRLDALNSEINGYSEVVISSHETRVRSTGETLISRHDARSGHVEFYRG
jgi:hypothetical protein